MPIQIAGQTIIFAEEEDEGIRIIIQHPVTPQKYQNDELSSDPLKRQLIADKLRAAAVMIAPRPGTSVRPERLVRRPIGNWRRPQA